MAEEVTTSLSFTKNLKNFESVKVNVGYTSAIKDGETPEDAFDRVYEVVEGELAEQLENVTALVRKD